MNNVNNNNNIRYAFVKEDKAKPSICVILTNYNKKGKLK